MKRKEENEKERNHASLHRKICQRVIFSLVSGNKLWKLFLYFRVLRTFFICFICRVIFASIVSKSHLICKPTNLFIYFIFRVFKPFEISNCSPASLTCFTCIIKLNCKTFGKINLLFLVRAC